MDSPRYNALLDDYRRAVKASKDAVRNSRGAVGDDSRLAGQKAELMAQMCRHCREALMVHWREHHSSLAEKQALRELPNLRRVARQLQGCG